MAANKKGWSRKQVEERVWSDQSDRWKVVRGRLIPGPGRPSKKAQLFACLGEKVPFGSLSSIEKAVKKLEQEGKISGTNGVYIAHDSMGFARYGGRGQIFTRLKSHKKKYPKELLYFSFYLVAHKPHEREIETIILRAAGPQMILNTQKVGFGAEVGNVRDYEPNTIFFERQKIKGKKKSNSKP